MADSRHTSAHFSRRHTRGRKHERKDHRRDARALPSQKSGNGRFPVPERLLATLPFADISRTIAYNHVTGVSTHYVYALNDPYDPDPAIGGSSAAYWSELGINYGNYICWGSRITVTATTTDGADILQPAAVWVMPTTSSASSNTYIPDSIAAMKVIPMCRYSYVDTYDKPVAVVRNECKVRDLIGIQPDGNLNEYGGECSGLTKRLNGSITSNGTSPNVLLYWVIGIQATDASADTQFNVQVEIEYYTEFFEPVAPTYYNAEGFKGDPVRIVDGKVVEASEKADKEYELTGSEDITPEPPVAMSSSVLLSHIKKLVA